MRESQHPINIFDRLEALYVFCSDYHGGQASFLYELLGPLHNAGFRPRPSLDCLYENLSEDGELYYRRLKERFNGWGFGR